MAKLQLEISCGGVGVNYLAEFCESVSSKEQTITVYQV